MNQKWFTALLFTIGFSFLLIFCAIVVPPLLANPDILGALSMGFVNPYASGYAMDAILCWCILLVWVIYEAKQHQIKYGWIALLLGMAPGVATGFAFYLYIRMRQIGNNAI